MFTADILRGFTNVITVGTRNMTEKAVVAALVAAAEAARDRVINSATGYKPSYRQIVDEIEGAPLTAVKPDGYIMFAWQWLGEVAADTYLALLNRSPRQSGKYIDSILIFINDDISSLNAIDSSTKEVRIVATAHYSRRLEVGNKADGSPFVQQVPQHIVEETAKVSQRLYRDLATIIFEYVDLTNAYEHGRNPEAWHKRKPRAEETHVRYPSILITAKQA